MKIIYTERSLQLILEALNLSTDENGFVVDEFRKHKLDKDGNRFKQDQLIAIENKKFITNVFQMI